jgi:hypothetical protein
MFWSFHKQEINFQMNPNNQICAKNQLMAWKKTQITHNKKQVILDWLPYYKIQKIRIIVFY